MMRRSRGRSGWRRITRRRAKRRGVGSGPAPPVSTWKVGDAVSEEQMKLLIGQGRHTRAGEPDAPVRGVGWFGAGVPNLRFDELAGDDGSGVQRVQQQPGAGVEPPDPGGGAGPDPPRRPLRLRSGRTRRRAWALPAVAGSWPHMVGKRRGRSARWRRSFWGSVTVSACPTRRVHPAGHSRRTPRTVPPGRSGPRPTTPTTRSATVSGSPSSPTCWI